MPCKLCHRDELRCDPEKLLICSRCVQVLLRSTLEQIKRAHSLAIEKGYPEKAEALELFIQKGNSDGEQINTRRPPRHIAKHLDRRRGPKIDRPHKKPAGRLSEQEANAISQNQPELPVVP